MQIVAPGGVGKTQLVKKWRESLLGEDDHGGAMRAYDWSFYSQGTQQQASADDFFDKALRWFGETELEKYKDPWAKGERLAHLVKEHRTLLILDGLEPLQHPPGPLEGELSDPSLQSLLRGLAQDNPGLCVITTRKTVPDLAEISEPRRVTIDLNTLDEAEGAELLGLYGVRGTDEALRQASRDYEGHALALILLGTYLRDRFGGDIVQRNRVTWPPGMDDDSLPALSTDELRKGAPRFAKHARKVMVSYVTWFEHEPDDKDLSEEDPTINRAAVAILHLMGLFNRPADAGCLDALRAEPPIPGLTEALFASRDAEELWQQAVLRLRKAHLVADTDSSNLKSEIPNPKSLDAHPLIREHFAAQLAEHRADAAREAHRRLYEHLKQSAPKLPDNLEDMMPLYHAVSHGCKAELWQEVWDDVYVERIMRGQTFFSLHKLGAIGADLAALSCFFSQPWSLPHDALHGEATVSALAICGYCLRALGRLSDSRQPMESSLHQIISAKAWNKSAAQASNLSELSLTLGDVSSAVRQGEQSVELADRSGDAFERLSDRTTLADALHAAARGRLSAEAFAEAECMQKETEPQFPLLYSVRGYHDCDLLLDELSALSYRQFASASGDGAETLRRELQQVRNRAETTLEWVSAAGQDILSIALNHLTLGRTWLIEAKMKDESGRMKSGGQDSSFILPHSALDAAQQHLNESVALLRQSGMQDELPRGLLHRAAFWRAKFQITNDKSQIELDERDLAEAESIAERGTMLIFQIEAALERTRLALERMKYEGGRMKDGLIAQAREKLEEARRLIKQTEKAYEPHVPDWDKWEPPEYVGVFKKGEIVGYHCRNDEIERLQKQIDSVEEQ